MKTRPGFPHKDISWLCGLIAIRAPLANIKTLTSRKPSARRRETQGFELEGTGFTLLAWEKCEPDFAQQLSKKFKTTAAYLWDEDTSGWFGYSIFKDGTELEAFQCGANCDEELAEFAEELGDAMPAHAKRKKGWDVAVSHDGEDFQFRSKLAKAAGKELSKGLGFVDARFKALGIPIPKNFPEEQEPLSFPP